MKKKIVALCLVVCLLAIAIVGGTMAYFTDTEARTNVFTIGEIKIDLIEEFDDTADMLPAKEITKKVTVKNVGKNNAYVRVHIAVPAIGAGNGEVISMNRTATNAWTFTGSTYRTDIGTIPYNVYVATYNTALAPNVSIDNAIDSVTMLSQVTQDNIAEWNSTYGEGEWAKVYVYAEGVQADGFNDADTALNTAFGTPGTNYAPEFTASTNAADEARLILALGVDSNGNVTLTKNIKTTANLTLNGGSIDGNGKNLTKVDHTPADGTVNAGIAPTGGTIKNISISGETLVVGNDTYSFRAVYGQKGLTSNLYIDNAVLEGGYAINIQAPSGFTASGALVVNKTELKGWVSYGANAITGARFTECKFTAQGTAPDASGNNLPTSTFRPYVDTVLNNCEFNAGYNFSAGAGTNLIIELNNCKVGGQTVTAADFATQFNVDDALKACSVIVDGVKVVFN